MSDTLNRVKNVTGEILGIDPSAIGDNSKFTQELGGDSVKAAEWVAGLEAEFDIEISAKDAMTIFTIGDAVKAVEKAAG